MTHKFYSFAALLFTTAFLLFDTTSAGAQRLVLGYRSTYNSGSYSHPPASIYTNGDWEPVSGIENALFVQLPLSSRLYLQPELGYFRQPMKGEVPNGSSSVSPSIFKVGEIIDVVQVPLLLGYRLGKSKGWQGHLAGGMNIGFVLDKEVETARYYGASNDGMDIESNIFGLALEGGFGYAFGKFSVGAHARYNWANLNTRLRQDIPYTATWTINRYAFGVQVGWLLRD
jgi:hypothetical protein